MTKKELRKTIRKLMGALTVVSNHIKGEGQDVTELYQDIVRPALSKGHEALLAP